MPRTLSSAVGMMLLAFGVLLFLGAPHPMWPPASPDPTSSSAQPVLPATRATATPSASATAIPPIPDGYRVAIPRLGIDLPIAEGDLGRDATRQETPEGYAFHYPGSALPEDDRNCYLYAHARAGMFLALWNARVGDVVLITAPDGAELRYVVDEIHPRVPPGDTMWTEPTPPRRVTLQTSTGPDPADPRFIVVARPVG